MTSLTTLTATSSLMHTAGDGHRAASHPSRLPQLAPSRVRPWAAVAAVVICVSLLGSIVVGLTAPANTPAPMAIAAAESM
jgi:hypothetical protein